MWPFDQLASLFHREPTTLRESSMSPVFTDPDANLTATQLGSAYVRRLTDTPERDLDPMTHERAQAIAFYLYDRNPMGKRITEMSRDYVVGDGITVSCTEEAPRRQKAIQTIIDRHWNDAVNRFDLKLPKKVLELGLYGEQCYLAFVNPVNGHVRWGYLDPSTIAKAIPNPENAEEVIAIQTKAPLGKPAKRYRVIHEEADPNSPWFGRLVPARTDETGQIVTETYLDDDKNAVAYAGSCLWFTVNNVSNATRGRPDLLPNADWVDALDQLLFGEVDRAFLLKNFVWDVTYQGASRDEVLAYLAAEGAPRPGEIRGHNEKVTWQALAPSLNAADSDKFVDMLVSYIATGSGLPKTWLNGTENVNKATATELGEPAFKHLSERQRHVRYMVEQMVRFALDQAETHSALPRRNASPGTLPPAWAFSVNAPELRTRDLASAATSLQAVVTAVVAGIGEKLIDISLGQEVLALMIGQLGVDVDLEALRSRMQLAEEEAQASQAQPVPPDPNNPNNPLNDQTPGGDPLQALQQLVQRRNGPARQPAGSAA